jgi:hypothetical protein
VVHYLPCPTEDFLFTASAEKLLILRTVANTLERWSLLSYEKELTARVPERGTKILLTGSNSYGPVFVWAKGVPMLLDLNSLKELTDVGDLSAFQGGINLVHRYRVRVSADGTAFTSWYLQSPSYTPFFRMMHFYGDAVETHSVRVPGGVHTGVRFAGATAGANYAVTSQGYVYTEALKSIDAPDLVGAYLLPVGNCYFAALRWREVGRKKQQKVSLSVHTVADQTEIVRLVDLEEMDDLASNTFTYEKRFHLIPSAKVLITLPTSDHQIVIRKFDLKTLLKHSDHQYLFVDVVPPRVGVKGALYSHNIAVESRAGRVQFKLLSGPEGMTVAENGQLRWQVLPDHANARESVIVGISDASGKQIFHSFNIRIR